MFVIIDSAGVPIETCAFFDNALRAMRNHPRAVAVERARDGELLATKPNPIKTSNLRGIA